MTWPHPLPQWDYNWVVRQLTGHIYVSCQSVVSAFQTNFIFKRLDAYNNVIHELNFLHAAGDTAVDVIALVPNCPEGQAGFIMPRLQPIVSSQLSVEQKVNVMRQMENLIRTLHQRGIIHCDIKLANFLYDPSDGAVKLCDFGSAVWCNRSRPPYSGSERYYSARRLADQYLTLPMETDDDYYALGWTIWELFTGRIPFSHIENSKEVLQLILNGAKPDLDEIENEEARASIMSYCDIH